MIMSGLLPDPGHYPCEYDSRVKAMEVDTRPTEQYSEIGGLDKQIQDLIEAIFLP